MGVHNLKKKCTTNNKNRALINLDRPVSGAILFKFFLVNPGQIACPEEFLWSKLYGQH